jgi:23S rRNA (uracil1939-C5)-methyltransferase
MRRETDKERRRYEQVEIIDAGSEGKAIARVNDMVIFVPFVVPGDVVDIEVVRKKKSYVEGKAIKFHHYSEKRAEPFCSHFGLCGGCKWQCMNYTDQLFYKQKQVMDALQRIGKIDDPPLLPILASEKTTNYRNKLEYTFSNHKWFIEKSDVPPEEADANALGFHLPNLFDRVLDIGMCYLQEEPSNAIRLEAKRYALEHGLSFYDVRKWTGLLRNLIIRNSNSGDLMTIFVFNYYEKEVIFPMLEHFQEKFPQITSLFYVINSKKNDIINDLPSRLFFGKPYITEKMIGFKSEKELQFRIGPISFFQTNSGQAANLYRVAAEFAGFEGHETVYDLYTGTGTIANYIAGAVKKVVGIESVPAAIEDAKENAALNGITNTSFFAGETEKLLTPEFVALHGNPDIIVTDPPRSGMHEKVINAMLNIAPEKIVYISCNPATQARDIALLSVGYKLVNCQPVDMFPHTQHMESVVLLERGKREEGRGKN